MHRLLAQSPYMPVSIRIAVPATVAHVKCGPIFQVMELRSFFVGLACLVLLGWFVNIHGQVPAETRAEVAPDFSSAAAPFLKQYCIKCHGAEKPEADLSLPLNATAKDVARGRKTWEKVLKMVAAAEMPPAESPRPSPAEAERFTDLISSVLDYADRHAQPDPGRVTMRRLNRIEYANTVRDLVGVDFDPTESFPADDIGHGFDNIGDVLSISPVLMERYLEAAESIMARAITPEPPAVTKRHTAGRYTEPAGADVEKKYLKGKYRWISSDASEPIGSGPIQAAYKWEEDGEYLFRAKVYAECGESEVVRVAILVQGKDLESPASEKELGELVGKIQSSVRVIQSFEVTARSADNPMTLEARIPPMERRDKVLLALYKPAQFHEPEEENKPEDSSEAEEVDEPKDQREPLKLFVESLVLEGPMDMRPASHRRLLAVSKDLSEDKQTREVLSRFMRRAFRRTPAAEEVDRHVRFVAEAMAGGLKWEAAMQLGMQAILCSPKFLFRVELDDRPTASEMTNLDDFQLASRLSYFLWCSMPDDILLELAEKNQLGANLDSQVRRMLDDPRSRSLVDNFAMQWLQLQRIRTFAPDPKLFPQYDADLQNAMIEETKLFIDSIIREDRSILDLIDANYTFLNSTLAKHYGFSDLLAQKSDGRGRRSGGNRGSTPFERVSLPEGVRGGLLTQASVLTVTSNPTRTSPVKRGRWVLEQILGAPPPPPPPNVPELPSDENSVATGSLRQRLEVHRQNPSCANCHAKMDPIGFALENFNAIGAYREKDGDFAIDSSGSFPNGSTFTGPGDLKKIVREQKDQFTRCLTEKLLTYALGRGIEYYDRPTVEKIVAKMESQEYKFSGLVGAIVSSDAFRKRRGTSEAE